MSKLNSLGVLLCVMLVALFAQSSLIILSLDGAFSPDTNSFYQFSVYRQPVYGHWMALMKSYLPSWEAVKASQLVIFSFAVAIVSRELFLVSFLGKLSSIVFVGVQLMHGHYGMTNYVASLISEGLFYSLLLFISALLLRWFRLAEIWPLVVLIFLCVFTSQLKTTFLPVLGLIAVILVILVVWLLRLGKKIHMAKVASLVLALLIPIIILPTMLGKASLQISTAQNRLGFVIVPRVGLLPTPPELNDELRNWNEISVSWQRSSESLGPLAFSQFDAQFQELIRYHLYVPEVASKLEPGTLTDDEWLNGSGYERASQHAIQWIKHSPSKYLVNSSKHLLGLLFAAPLMTQTEREQIQSAFNAVSNKTWGQAKLRNDYPLGDLTTPISTPTNLFYIAIRVTVLIYLLIVIFAVSRLTMAFFRRVKCTKSDLAISLSFLLVVAISLAPALTVFPEIRYVYANLLIIFSGLFAYISLLKSRWNESHSFLRAIEN